MVSSCNTCSGKGSPVPLGLLSDQLLINRSIFSCYLKVLSGQIWSAWKWYHWIAQGRTSIAIYFNFFKFKLEFFIVFKVLIRFIQKYLQTSYFLGSRVVCVQTAIFFIQPGLQKTRESIQLSSRGWLVSRIFEEFKQTAIQTKIEQHFDGFSFIKLKCASK